MGAPLAALQAAATVALAPPRLDPLPRVRLEAMLAAGLEILECRRALHKAGLNVVGELLRGQGTFYEHDHYPENDVFDTDAHAQYYYHAHRGLEGEHGHFHTFVRSAGMPAGAAPLEVPHAEPWPSGDDALAHLIAVSMDAYGNEIGLFAPNRWVAGDTWYAARDVIAMLGRFRVDHAWPSWPVNRWLSAMFVLFRPHIEQLLLERDHVIGGWRERFPDADVLELRELDILARMPVSVEQTLLDVKAALRKRTGETQ